LPWTLRRHSRRTTHTRSLRQSAGFPSYSPSEFVPRGGGSTARWSTTGPGSLGGLDDEKAVGTFAYWPRCISCVSTLFVCVGVEPSTLAALPGTSCLGRGTPAVAGEQQSRRAQLRGQLNGANGEAAANGPAFSHWANPRHAGRLSAFMICSSAGGERMHPTRGCWSGQNRPVGSDHAASTRYEQEASCLPAVVHLPYTFACDHGSNGVGHCSHAWHPCQGSC